MFTEKEFISEGDTLRGRWYKTDQNQNSPCIIMCHGTSATISMGLSDYALEFQNRGLNVFLFDHAGFGRSEGANPQTINPLVQVKGINDAASFVKTESSLFNGKIILWGDSFAGMLVLVAGALLKEISGIVSFTAACGLKRLEIKDENEKFSKLKEIIDKGDFSQLEDLSREGPMPVVSVDQTSNPSMLTGIQAFKWFIDQGGKWNSGWENKVTRVIPKTAAPFTPFLTAPFIQVPTLMMIGKDDEMPQIGKDAQLAVYEKIKSTKELYEIDGGHFGALYPGSSLFFEAIEKQVSFIKSHI
jgi:alpha-beta hydrolase superfamily lysophospholipase